MSFAILPAASSSTDPLIVVPSSATAITVGTSVTFPTSAFTVIRSSANVGVAFSSFASLTFTAQGYYRISAIVNYNAQILANFSTINLNATGKAVMLAANNSTGYNAAINIITPGVLVTSAQAINITAYLNYGVLGTGAAGFNMSAVSNGSAADSVALVSLCCEKIG